MKTLWLNCLAPQFKDRIGFYMIRVRSAISVVSAAVSPDAGLSDAGRPDSRPLFATLGLSCMGLAGLVSVALGS